MGYPPELLTDGEEIQYQMRPHWKALIGPFLITALVLVAVIWITSRWSQWFSGGVGDVGRWVFLIAGLVLVALYGAKPLAYWLTTLYVITNRRIIIREGLVARQGSDIPLSKVQNVSFSVSILGRMLNYGRLSIESAGDVDVVINDVPDVERIQREVNRLHEEDDARRRGSSGQ